MKNTFTPITPEKAVRLTEKEKEVLNTLLEYVNETLRSNFQKGKIVTVSLTGLDKEHQPVEEKAVTEKIINEIILTFKTSWNIKRESSHQGTYLVFSDKSSEV